MCLSGPRLSICEYSSVIAFQNFLGKGATGLLEHLTLASLVRKDIVEGEGFVIISLVIDVAKSQLFFGRIKNKAL
jgi:hypothetical protein